MRKIYILLALIAGAVIAVPSFSEGSAVNAISPFYNVLQNGQHYDHDLSLLYAEQADAGDVSEEEEVDLDYLEEEKDVIADPLEPINRIFFSFNDKLYFWLLKPVAQGYSAVLPEGVRISVRNFFDNLMTPIRFVNNLLQFKLKPAGNELVRFGVNTTIGVVGLFDVAKSHMGIKLQDEDLGQSLGKWGLGPGFFITWPVLGPSSLRDSVGDAGV